MPYVRLSLMKPSPGRGEAVVKMLDELLASFAKQPGFIAGYRLVEPIEDGEVGRITIWESEEMADHAAVSEHVLAVRSQLHLSIEAGHQERGFIVPAMSTPETGLKLLTQ